MITCDPAQFQRYREGAFAPQADARIATMRRDIDTTRWVEERLQAELPVARPRPRSPTSPKTQYRICGLQPQDDDAPLANVPLSTWTSQPEFRNPADPHVEDRRAQGIRMAKSGAHEGHAPKNERRPRLPRDGRRPLRHPGESDAPQMLPGGEWRPPTLLKAPADATRKKSGARRGCSGKKGMHGGCPEEGGDQRGNPEGSGLHHTNRCCPERPSRLPGEGRRPFREAHRHCLEESGACQKKALIEAVRKKAAPNPRGARCADCKLLAMKRRPSRLLLLLLLLPPLFSASGVQVWTAGEQTSMSMQGLPRRFGGAADRVHDVVPDRETSHIPWAEQT